MSEAVRIAEINEERSRRLTPRRYIDEDAVERYARCLDELPPIALFRVGEDLLLADGRHRLAAHKKAGREAICADVHDGTEEELLEAAILANLRHGRPWTRSEKTDCIDAWLRLHPERADNWIADDLLVSKNTVAVRRGFLVRTCQIDRFEKTIGRDGKARPYEYSPQEPGEMLGRSRDKDLWAEYEAAFGESRSEVNERTKPLTEGVYKQVWRRAGERLAAQKEAAADEPAGGALTVGEPKLRWEERPALMELKTAWQAAKLEERREFLAWLKSRHGG